MDVKIQAFVKTVQSGKLTIEQVPEIYRAEVQKALDEEVAE